MHSGLSLRSDPSDVDETGPRLNSMGLASLGHRVSRPVSEMFKFPAPTSSVQVRGSERRLLQHHIDKADAVRMCRDLVFVANRALQDHTYTAPTHRSTRSGLVQDACHFHSDPVHTPDEEVATAVALAEAKRVASRSQTPGHAGVGKCGSQSPALGDPACSVTFGPESVPGANSAQQPKQSFFER